MSKAPANPDGLVASLKRAFKWHWHMLGLGAATVMALLSGNAGMWLPVVAAAEVGYMGMLGMNPRFQAILKLEERKKQNVPPPLNPAQRFQQLMSFLSSGDVQRFEGLRRRCADRSNSAAAWMRGRGIPKWIISAASRWTACCGCF